MDGILVALAWNRLGGAIPHANAPAAYPVLQSGVARAQGPAVWRPAQASRTLALLLPA